MRFLAPAKVNLSLRVLGRRPDGFHEIETLMLPISVSDELEIARGEPGSGVAFTCDDPEVPGDETNLVVRAARLFFQRTRPGDVRIALTKRIPHGAGLGGGSSDAATTLLALDEVFGTNLGTAQLASMAADLGSDVPFFVYRSAAICRGRGESVTPVDFPPALPLLLLKPPFGVPTPWAYGRWADALPPEEPATSHAQFAWGTLINDLERPVFEKFVFLAHLKAWLGAQPETAGAIMSGSGSTMLALLREVGSGAELAVRARDEFGSSLWMQICHGL